MEKLKNCLRFLLVFGMQYVAIKGQVPFVGAGNLNGGIPYPNQETDIGVACLRYEKFAHGVCKPTPTEFAMFRPKCDQYRLYCKGWRAPLTGTPDPQILVPPPPPDVCPQISYCSTQKGQYDRVCARPPDIDSLNFCKRYKVYCANVPPDTDGACSGRVQQQQQFEQQQYQAMMAQQQALAAQSGANQPFNGNPFPFSQSQSLPGTFAHTGIIGKK